MKIAVTAANGQLGSSIVNQLKKEIIITEMILILF